LEEDQEKGDDSIGGDEGSNTVHADSLLEVSKDSNITHADGELGEADDDGIDETGTKRQDSLL